MKVGINSTTGEFVVFDEDEEHTTWTVEQLTRRASYLNKMACELLSVEFQYDRMTNQGCWDRRQTPTSYIPEYKRPQWRTTVYGQEVGMGRGMTTSEIWVESISNYINRPSPFYDIFLKTQEAR